MSTRSLALAIALLTAAAAPLSAAEEAVDLEMVTRIRDEGFTNSKVMDTVGYLTDVIGPRVTGSPQMREANDWTRQRLESWGLANAHLEGFQFGRGWSLERAVVQMVKPSPATLLAVPRGYTPGTDGPKRGKVVKVKIESEADAEKYRGQLAGRIVLLGDPRDTANPEKAQFLRYSEEQLDDLSRFDLAPARRPPVDRETAARRLRLQRFLRPFFVAEKALATIEVSPTDAGIVLVGRGGIGGGHGSRAHPAGARGQAAPHHPHRPLERRGGRAAGLQGLRGRAPRHARRHPGSARARPALLPAP